MKRIKFEVYLYGKEMLYHEMRVCISHIWPNFLLKTGSTVKVFCVEGCLNAKSSS